MGGWSLSVSQVTGSFQVTKGVPIELIKWRVAWYPLLRLGIDESLTKCPPPLPTQQERVWYASAVSSIDDDSHNPDFQADLARKLFPGHPFFPFACRPFTRCLYQLLGNGERSCGL